MPVDYDLFFEDVDHSEEFITNVVNPLIVAEVLEGYVEGSLRKVRLNQNATRLEALKLMLLSNNYCSN